MKNKAPEKSQAVVSSPKGKPNNTAANRVLRAKREVRIAAKLDSRNRQSKPWRGMKRELERSNWQAIAVRDEKGAWKPSFQKWKAQRGAGV